LTAADLYRLFRLSMTLTKQQKIYAAVLGLAVAAFAFDRFVLGPGDSADDLAVKGSATQRGPRRPVRPPARAATGAPAGTPAGSVQRPAGTTAGVILPPGAAAAATPAAGSLALRLSQIANPPGGVALDLERVPDAFRPSAVLTGAVKAEPVTVTELHDAAQEFYDKYKDKLTMVLKNGDGGVVIINKKRLSIGQQIDGFRLVAVKAGSAVLWRGNQRVELRTSASEKLAGGGD
jgi:hypothetical protein